MACERSLSGSRMVGRLLFGCVLLGHDVGLLGAAADGAVGEVDAEERDDLELQRRTRAGSKEGRAVSIARAEQGS